MNLFETYIAKYIKSNPAIRDLLTVIAFSVSVYTLFYLFNIFSFFVDLLEGFPGLHIAEIFVSAMLIAVSLGYFSFRRWYQIRYEIVERKKTERKLHHSRTQLQAVLDGVPDIILQVDFNMRILWANKAATDKNPNCIGQSINSAFVNIEGLSIETYCRWAMETKQIEKGIRYQPAVDDQSVDKYWEAIGVPIMLSDGRVYGAIAIARNVTDHMQIEATRKLLASIVESTYDAIIAESDRGVIHSWNKGAEKIFGYSTNEAIGKPFSILFSPELIPNLNKIRSKIKKGESIESSEIECITKDNKKIFTSMTFSPIMHATGKIIGLSAIVRDITAQKRTEAALKQSEERLSNFMNSATDNFILLDKDFNIIEMNEAAVKLYKTRKEDIIGMNSFDLVPELKNSERHKMYLRLLETGEPFTIEDYVPDERFGNVHLFQKAFKVGDGIGIISTDITQRIIAQNALKESEQFNKTIISSVSEGILVFDSNLKCILWSTFMEELTGVTSEDVINKQYNQVLKVFFNIDLENYLLQALGGSTVNSDEVYYSNENTSRKAWLICTFSPHINSQGKIIGVVSSFRDITLRKLADDELKASRLRLRNLATHLENVREEERKQIAFVVHDDLGQAMTALKIELAWLKSKLGNDQEVLIDRAKSMTDLIDTTINKVRSISTQLRPSILDHFGLLAAIEWQAEDFQKRTMIPCEVNSEVREIVFNDNISIGIFRIFQECLTNITRHAEASRVDVWIKNVNGYLELIVRDDGVGIPEEKMNDFKSFGLIGIREKAYIAGGKAVISSNNGSGTEILVRIPLSEDEVL